MKRTGQYRNLLIAASAVTALSLVQSPAGAAADACPAPVPSHIPAAPPPPATLNLGPIKDLLVEYHQKFYDADVAAVFESAQNYVEKSAGEANRPALVLDIDETSLTNWPNLHADDFGFVPDGSCDELPAGPCGFNAWVLKGSATAIAPAHKLFEAAKLNGVPLL